MENMTVNQFIKKLQELQPALREKHIIIVTPNGMEVDPEIKMLLEDKYNLFGGIDNVKAMVITF